MLVKRSEQSYGKLGHLSKTPNQIFADLYRWFFILINRIEPSFMKKMLEKLKKGNSKEIPPHKILLFPNALDFGQLCALSYKQHAHSSEEAQKWVDGCLAV